MSWISISDNLPKSKLEITGKGTPYFSPDIDIKADNKSIEGYYGVELKKFFRNGSATRVKGVTHWKHKTK